MRLRTTNHRQSQDSSATLQTCSSGLKCSRRLRVRSPLPFPPSSSGRDGGTRRRSMLRIIGSDNQTRTTTGTALDASLRSPVSAATDTSADASSASGTNRIYRRSKLPQRLTSTRFMWLALRRRFIANFDGILHNGSLQCRVVCILHDSERFTHTSQVHKS